MKAIKISNVNLVANHSLHYNTWRNTYIQFMIDIKTTNVNHVANANHLMKHNIWRGTSTQFMKATKISNVNLVVNHSLHWNTWRNTWIKSMKATKIKNVTCNNFWLYERGQMYYKIVMNKPSFFWIFFVNFIF